MLIALDRAGMRALFKTYLNPDHIPVELLAGGDVVQV